MVVGDKERWRWEKILNQNAPQILAINQFLSTYLWKENKHYMVQILSYITEQIEYINIIYKKNSTYRSTLDVNYDAWATRG